MSIMVVFFMDVKNVLTGKFVIQTQKTLDTSKYNDNET